MTEHRRHPGPRPWRALGWASGLLAIAICTGGCGDTDDRPASFAYIHAAIIQPSCTTSNCHSSLTSQAGLPLETVEAAYVSLTGRVCGAEDVPGQPVRNHVAPGRPEQSKLMYLLLGQEVDPMPPDIPLPDRDIDLIERWILEGAPCN